MVATAFAASTRSLWDRPSWCGGVSRHHPDVELRVQRGRGPCATVRLMVSSASERGAYRSRCRALGRPELRADRDHQLLQQARGPNRLNRYLP